MQARLKVVQDNANLKQVKLLPITVIGRGADCHLKIASTQVSRKHCRITVTETEVLIEDLTSSNGTFVDQTRIPSGKPMVVAPGAKLQIGPATFIVDYAPPVNLETMPTTVIKASELPPLSSTRMAKGGSEGSIPTIDPFAAAVAEGSAASSQMTPLPHDVITPPGAQSPAAIVGEDEVTLMEPVTVSQPPPLPPPIVESFAPPIPAAPLPAAPVAEQSPPPAVAPVVPAAAIPVAPATPPIAPPAPAVAAAPVASTAPVAGGFDFLGGAATAAGEPNAFGAFQFDIAAPAAPQMPPSPPPSAPKPAAAKKPLLGLFGKKDKGTAAPPPPVAAPAVPAAATANGNAEPFNFAPPQTPAAVPVPPPPLAPAEPAAPPAADDPFAFLR